MINAYDGPAPPPPTFHRQALLPRNTRVRTRWDRTPLCPQRRCVYKRYCNGTLGPRHRRSPPADAAFIRRRASSWQEHTTA